MPIDYKKYPSHWKSEIVPAVLKRANNCCQECGLKNHTIAWAVKFDIKDDNGRYVQRSVWFRVEADAKREANGMEHRMKEVKVILTISHTDHDEGNHNVQLDRLKALCQICHLRYDAKEKYRRVTEKWAKNNKQIPLI